MAYENNFFDFETTDDFLESISPDLARHHSLSSNSGDETGIYTGCIGEGVDPASEINLGDINELGQFNADLTGAPDASAQSQFAQGTQANQQIQPNQLAQQQVPNTPYYNPHVNQNYQTYPNEYLNNSTSMSSTSYSNNSTSNESPLVSSTQTSPEPMMTKRSILDAVEEQVRLTSSDDEEVIPKSSLTKKSSKVTKPKSKDKTSHNMIEKKYRTNINSKILTLRDAVPSLRIVSGSKDVSISDLEGLTPASKLNKASVLTKATEYIKHLEAKNEMLRLQNIKLQKLIQRASLNQNMQQVPSHHQQPQIQQQQQQMHQQQQLQQQQQQQQQHQLQLQQQQPPQLQQQNQQFPQHSFGYYPEQTYSSYNTPMQQSFSNNSTYTPEAPTNNNNSKYLLGGMATMMATSLFAGGGGVGTNDFKGLSSLPIAPFIPHFILHPPAMILQLWNLVQMVLIAGSLVSIILPNLTIVSGDKTKISEQSLLKNWLLVSFGLQMPHTVGAARKSEILARLSGLQKNPWRSLVNDYILLSISEVEFENCLLSLVIGRLIMDKYPILSRFIGRNVQIQASIALKLEYKGDSVGLTKLNQLIRRVDGLSILGAQDLCQRLSNMINGLPVNTDVTRGMNHVKYVEILCEHPQQFYHVLYEWRMLGIVDELLMKYLEHQADQTVVQQICKDSQALELLIGNQASGTLVEYFRLFRAVVDDEYAPQLLREINNGVSKSLNYFRFMVEGHDLTDTELVEDEEEEYEEDEVIQSEEPEKEVKYEPTLSSQSKLISSLNLVSEEQFIVLTSSLAVNYFRKGKVADAAKIMSRLRLKESSLTLVSFTSIVKMINVIIPGIEQHVGASEEEAIVDELISKCRVWLEEVKFVKFSVKSDVSKNLVEKGLIVNGMAETEAE